MKVKHPIALALRLAILLPLLAAALLLFHWSRQGDPRFYYFLTTRPGHALARALHWHVLPGGGLPPPEPVGRMTPAERKVKEKLEAELEGMAPSCRLVLKNGKSMFGRLIDEGPRSILFRESFGNNGSLSARIRRERILRLEPLQGALPEITYRDVRFQMEFPNLKLYKREPYTIMTDERYFRVEGSVKLLQRLYAEFMVTFQPLIEKREGRDNIQVLFFSDEKAYRRYQHRNAPHMESSVGFYSPWSDRFVLFDQQHSDEMSRFGQRLEEQAAHYAANQRMYGGASRIAQWKRAAGQRMSRLAEEQTRQTIRHEGAHQLFFTCGVHSPYRMENEWLYEGLAVYCELDHLGTIAPYRVNQVRQALTQRKAIPLEDLVDYRSGRGFFALGAPERIDLAYSESWALVHFLMQPAHRDAFFSFIRHLRDSDRFREVLHTPRYQLLCRHLGLTPSALDEAWREYVARL